MITKIEIAGIPPFKEKAILETDKKVNLIYGLNGTGKSTISNLLFDIEHGGTPDGIKIEYNGGSDTSDSYEMVVYNQKFVQANFYESAEIKGIFSLSKDNAEAQTAIENAVKEKGKLEEIKKAKNDEKDNCIQEKQNERNYTLNEIWEIKTEYSGAGQVLDYCLAGLKGDKSRIFDYLNAIIKTPDPPKRSIEEIKKDAEELQKDDVEELIEIKPLDIVIDEIEKNEIFSKVIVGNENSSVAGLIKELNNSDWVKQGRAYLHPMNDNDEQKCPFCQQKTITNDFIKEIETFFGGAYEKDLALLNTLLAKYRAAVNTVSKSEAFNRYSILISLQPEYESVYKSLTSILNSNIKSIEDKIEKPSVPIKIEDTLGIINKLNDLIETANDLIKKYNEKLKQKDNALNELKEEFWNLMRWKYDSVLDRHVKSEKDIQKRLDGIINEINVIDGNVNKQNVIISENQSKTINIEDAINNINDALVDMGIVDFKIKKYSDSLYQLHREGQSGDVFKSLSEGEKMIISLLYFIERCKGKESKEKNDKKKIVVIDDPISSLSHIYVYNVGRLLMQEFTDANSTNKNVKKYDQIFLLTHSLYFFYEMAIIKRKGNDDDYNQKLFRIQKNQQGSHIYEMKYSDIQNDYHAYWMIVKDANVHPALIANCMRNIIEYFFNFVEKKELNNVFNNSKLQDPRFRAFNRYINRESHSLGQNIFDIKEFNYDDFKEAFRLVFELTDYKEHYDRMMKL
ncbi:MAG: AAA family ATPase [Bacteroidales bacterium]|nr:AAA family ATPase [Bacteroidales bacterium]